MSHPIHWVCSFEPAGSYTLRIRFERLTEQVIDFQPILDCDPAKLHDWQAHKQAFRELAQRWQTVQP